MTRCSGRVVLAGGTLVDGSGTTRRTIDVVIDDGLVASGRGADDEVIDCSGCFVFPGFIDFHANLTWGPLVDPDCLVAVHQGVTTALTGNCGGSLFPATGDAAIWARRTCAEHGVDLTWRDATSYAETVGSTAVRLLPQVGHATVRAAAVGFSGQTLDPEQLDDLELRTRVALADGAWGVSFGLTYPPGAFADATELERVCATAATRRRLCTFHLRLESDQLVRSTREVCELALRTGARTVLCHHKALGRRNWGATARTLEMIQDHRERGADLALDLYPFTAAARNLAMLFPDDAHEGGRDRFVERLRDHSRRAALLQGLTANVETWDARWSDTCILAAPETPELEGRNAAEVIAERGLDGLCDALAQNGGRIMSLYEGASWDDLARVAVDARAVIGSDGDTQVTGRRAHPRSYVTVPTYLAEVVVTRELMTLEEAVHHGTGLPAALLDRTDIGTLTPGCRADIVVVPEDRIGSVPDDDGRTPWPRDVLVDGQFVLRDGHHTGARPARVELAG